MGVIFTYNTWWYKILIKFKWIHFLKDYNRIKAWRDKKKAEHESKRASLNVFNEKSKSCRQQAINIVENNSIEIPIPLPTELFGPIQKIPLYLINQNVSIRADTTPGVSNRISYRKEGRIQAVLHNGLEYLYEVTIMLEKSIELVSDVWIDPYSN